MKPETVIPETVPSEGRVTLPNDRALQSALGAAAERLRPHIIRTGLLTSERLDQHLGGRIFLKPENLQVTGSFKARGAMNALLNLPERVRARGVFAYSSGNHAQGLARAAQRLGVAARIAMPQDAPRLKIERTRALGAELVLYDWLSETREAVAAREQGDRHRIEPYDDFDVIMGQGTAGLEMAEDMTRLGVRPDLYLCCTGGGGLLAGTTLALAAQFSELDVYAVEPEGFDDWVRSLRSGRRERNARLSGSLCDAIVTPSPGLLPWELMQNRLTAGLAVSDTEALAAVRWAAQELKLVLEPGGAVALAALLSGKLELAGRTALVMLSGGNIDPALLQSVLNA